MALIEIYIRTRTQLFDSLDPSPFHERSLDRNADSYILECAGEHPSQEKLHLIIHAPENLGPYLADMTQAIHSHYRFAHVQAYRRHRRKMHTARVTLLAGSAIFIVSLALYAFLGGLIATPVRSGIGEGLLVLGWVALWRPIDLLLFERFESRLERQLLDRLARIPVEFRVMKDDRP